MYLFWLHRYIAGTVSSQTENILRCTPLRHQRQKLQSWTLLPQKQFQEVTQKAALSLFIVRQEDEHSQSWHSHRIEISKSSRKNTRDQRIHESPEQAHTEHVQDFHGANRAFQQLLSSRYSAAGDHQLQEYSTIFTQSSPASANHHCFSLTCQDHQDKLSKFPYDIHFSPKKNFLTNFYINMHT